MPDYSVVSGLYAKTRICTYHESLLIKLSAGGMSKYDDPNTFIFHFTRYTKDGHCH